MFFLFLLLIQLNALKVRHFFIYLSAAGGWSPRLDIVLWDCSGCGPGVFPVCKLQCTEIPSPNTAVYQPNRSQKTKGYKPYVFLRTIFVQWFCVILLIKCTNWTMCQSDGPLFIWHIQSVCSNLPALMGWRLWKCWGNDIMYNTIDDLHTLSMWLPAIVLHELWILVLSF